MTDEEKKAIERAKNGLKLLKNNKTYTNVFYDISDLTMLVNLIEKQSKEIEELKEKDDANLAYYDQIYQNGIYTGQKAVEYKIKAKIEEIDEEIKVKREIAKNPMDRVSGRLLTDSIVELEKTKKVLQSLLEKE